MATDERQHTDDESEPKRPCPACGDHVDPDDVLDAGECPECATPYGELVELAGEQ